MHNDKSIREHYNLASDVPFDISCKISKHAEHIRRNANAIATTLTDFVLANKTNDRFSQYKDNDGTTNTLPVYGYYQKDVIQKKLPNILKF